MPDHKTQQDYENLEHEYREFVRAVSHDFSAPMRHVKDFAKLLISERDDLNEDEKEYVQFIEGGVETLYAMLKALQELSRFNHDHDLRQEIDANAVVKDILEDLEDATAKTQTKFNIETLPIIHGNLSLFKTLLGHLIDNAVTFHAKDTEERIITISHSEDKDFWKFCVQDNGIGIHPDHHDIIFRIFHRLRPDDYTGLGTGLTFAKKIVQLHGGSINIESEENDYTSISFTIKKN